MSEKILPASIRKQSGKGYAKVLRRDGKVPGVFYIRGEDAVPLTLEAKTLSALIASKPALISLQLDDGSKKEAIIREVQRHPISSVISHVDFMGITRGHKITVTVPVHVTGTAAGTKIGGILESLTRELEIECLPKDMPDSLEIDVTHLGIGDSIHVSDLSYENITILTGGDVSIVSVIVPKVFEEPVAAGEVPEVEEAAEEEAPGEKREDGEDAVQDKPDE